jgi:DNA-binding transcriptional ArsR family regulator
MSGDAEAAAVPVEVFKALSDPVRWSIVAQMAKVDELACVTLESTLSVSKPTISYHTRILNQAGLISVRKEGRNYFYTLRRDALHQVLDSLWELAPTPRPVVGQERGYVPAARPGRRPAARRRQAGEGRDTGEEAVVLTW